MAKISQSPPVIYIPPSDWEKDIWNEDDYKRHGHEFENILTEYRDIRSKNGDKAIEARNEWMKRKGALTENGVTSEYLKYRSMFDRFAEWLAFKERREGVKVENYQQMLDRNSDLVKMIDEAVSAF